MSNDTSSYTPFISSNDALDATTSSLMVPEDVRKILSALSQLNTTNDRPPTFSGKLYNPRAQKAQGREQWREDIYESRYAAPRSRP